MQMKPQSGKEEVSKLPKCCQEIHVGWICPKCGKAIAIKPHSGNDPVPIGKLSPPQVTVVQGDYIQGSVIKDSVVMGDVPQNESKTNIENQGQVVEGNISQDSILMNEIDDLLAS